MKHPKRVGYVARPACGDAGFIWESSGPKDCLERAPRSLLGRAPTHAHAPFLAAYRESLPAVAASLCRISWPQASARARCLPDRAILVASRRAPQGECRDAEPGAAGDLVSLPPGSRDRVAVARGRHARPRA